MIGGSFQYNTLWASVQLRFLYEFFLMCLILRTGEILFHLLSFSSMELWLNTRESTDILGFSLKRPPIRWHYICPLWLSPLYHFIKMRQPRTALLLWDAVIFCITITCMCYIQILATPEDRGLSPMQDVLLRTLRAVVVCFLGTVKIFSDILGNAATWILAPLSLPP